MNVKEVLNKFLENEDKLIPLNPNRKYNVRVGLNYGKENIEVPPLPLNTFTTIYNCIKTPIICPILEKSLNYIEEGKHYCNICKKTIYKVDSLKKYLELSNKEESLLISQKVFEDISNNIDKKSMKKIEESLKISRLFYVYRYFNDFVHSGAYIVKYKEVRFKPTKEYTFCNLTVDWQIKQIILQLLMSKEWKENLKLYISYGVDFGYLFSEVCPKLKDDSFSNLTNELYEKYLEL